MGLSVTVRWIWKVYIWPNKLNIREWFNPRSSHTKDSKKALDAALLSTQHYKVRIKSKVVQSRKWSGPSPTPRCSGYCKGRLWLTLDYRRQLYLLYWLYVSKWMPGYSNIKRSVIDWFIPFNDMPSHPGLFDAKRLENRLHCTFICVLIMHLLFKRVFWQVVLSNRIWIICVPTVMWF